MRKRLAIAILFSMLSMVCGYFYISGVTAAETGGRKLPMLVAAQEIPPGTRLTRDMLAVREIPEAFVNPDAITAGPAEEARLVGRAVMTKLTQGQPLLWSSFDAQHLATQRLSSGVPRHKRALTVPVDLSGGFAGMLRAGDHVDVLGTFSQQQGQSQTVTLLQNVVVLAAGDQRGDGEAPAGRSFNSVTLAVDLDQAELLQFSQQRGALGFALRGEGDFETVNDIPEKSFTDVLDGKRRQLEYRRHDGQRTAELTTGRPRAMGAQ